MSKSIPTSKVILNGKHYRYEDTNGFNSLQLAHRNGELDLYKEIPQQNGKPLPSVADQWKEDFKRKLKHVKSTGNR
jgi:hypothetical protein